MVEKRWGFRLSFYFGDEAKKMPIEGIGILGVLSYR